MLETGNTEAAKQCFGRAVELSPEKGYSKYMALGQLFEGQQSIQCYQKGIELMVKEMQEHQEKQVAAACAQDDIQKELCRSISSAYCSVAEIYMTDCCDEEGAEEKCKSSIEKSIEADNSNPEAYQMMASFLLVKQDKDNAKEAINKSVSLWLPKFKEREKSTSEDFDPVEAVPLTYQARVQTAQILTEVEEYQTAFEILEALLDEDDEVIQLDIVSQNYISPPDLDKPIVVTEVEHAAFDMDGNWLVTVERRDDGETAMEMRLKFWMFDKKSQEYVLNTNVDLPYSRPINTLKLRPKSLGDAAPMAVTTSDDRKFKLWCLVDDTDIYRKTVCWNCDSVGYYRDYPARAADFSCDGSLLAVSFKLTLTLWDPDSNALRTRLDCMTGTAIKHVLFGQEESSHLLVATTETNMIVWNILTCTVYWSIPLSVSVLIPNPGTDYIAAFTKDNTLFVFRPQHSSPDYTQQAISKHAVVHAVFLPREKPVKSDITWHQQAQLYFLNNKQSLLSLTTEEEEEALESQDEVVAMQQNLPQTPYSLLIARERKTGVEETESNVITGMKGEPGAEVLNQLLHTPAHVLPPINTLCNDFVTALLISKSGNKKLILQGHDDDDDDDDDSSESDSGESEDSDMETVTVDQTKDTDTHSISVGSSGTDVAQSEADRLSRMSPREFSWMKCVFSAS